jgi:hypothetical protein
VPAPPGGAGRATAASPPNDVTQLPSRGSTHGRCSPRQQRLGWRATALPGPRQIACYQATAPLPNCPPIVESYKIMLGPRQIAGYQATAPLPNCPPIVESYKIMLGPRQIAGWLSGNCPIAKTASQLSNCRVLQHIVGAQANFCFSGNCPTAKLPPNCRVLQNSVGTQANSWLSGNCPAAKLASKC